MAVQKDLDFGMKCIKYMLCMANLMFVIVGLLLISIGYTIKNIYGNFEQFMEAYYYDPATLAIVIGFFIFAIAMFGCVGAVRESTCLVNTYAFFLTIILVLELSVSIAAYAMRPSIEGAIYENMASSMDYNIPYNAFAWNATQYNLQCCGINSCEEWTNRYFNGSGPGFVAIDLDDFTTVYVPPTCCADENCSPSSLYTRGCLPRLTFIVSQCALLLGLGALCVSFIQVLGIVFASLLARSIRKVKTQMLIEKDERRRQFYEQMLKNQEEKVKTPVFYTPKESDA